MSQCVNCLREARSFILCHNVSCEPIALQKRTSKNLREAKTMPRKSPDLTHFETSALKKFFLKMNQNLKIRQKA